MIRDQRIPLIILSGFLGAGKTTLLKSVLNDPTLANTMVIVNEIGEVGIDHQLLERSEEETILLDNGCMCCELRGDLQALLVDLMMRIQRGELPWFDRIVVEMSGLADPGPVLQTIYSDAALVHDYRVARVATLIDPLHFQATSAAPLVAVSQVAAADLIIITKTDVASNAQVQAALNWAKALNGFARYTRAYQGNLDFALLEDPATAADVPDAALDRLSRSVQVLGQALRSAAFIGDEQEDAGSGEFEGSYLKNRGTLHPQNVTSFLLRFPEPPTRLLFEQFLTTLIRLRGKDILRVKGIVYFKNTTAPYLIQGVRHVFAAPVELNAAAVKVEQPAMVFVAQDLKARQVESLWSAMRQLAE